MASPRPIWLILWIFITLGGMKRHDDRLSYPPVPGLSVWLSWRSERSRRSRIKSNSIIYSFDYSPEFTSSPGALTQRWLWDRKHLPWTNSFDSYGDSTIIFLLSARCIYTLNAFILAVMNGLKKNNRIEWNLNEVAIYRAPTPNLDYHHVLQQKPSLKPQILHDRARFQVAGRHTCAPIPYIRKD